MKNLPLSILISMPIVVAVYVLMNISYLSAMSPQELFDSEAVGVQWAQVVLGSWNWLIPLFVFISAFGALHAFLFASGRQVNRITILIQIQWRNVSGILCWEGRSSSRTILLCEQIHPDPLARLDIYGVPDSDVHLDEGRGGATEHVHGVCFILLWLVNVGLDCSQGHKKK